MLALHYLHIRIFPHPSPVCSCLSDVSYRADEPSASTDSNLLTEDRRYVHGRESKHESPPSPKKWLPPNTSNSTALSYTKRESSGRNCGVVGFLIPVLGCSGFNERQININTIFYSVLTFCVVCPSQLLQEA